MTGVRHVGESLHDSSVAWTRIPRPLDHESDVLAFTPRQVQYIFCIQLHLYCLSSN